MNDGHIISIPQATREDAQMAIKVLENTSDRGDWDAAMTFAAKRVLMAYFNHIAPPPVRVLTPKEKAKIETEVDRVMNKFGVR